MQLDIWERNSWLGNGQLEGDAVRLLICLIGIGLWAQSVPMGSVAPTGSLTPPSFVQASSGDSSSSTTVSSAAKTTTTGNLLVVTYGAEIQCSNSLFQNHITGPTDTAGDSFIPVFPGSGVSVFANNATVTNGGSGYTTGATCALSGAGGAGTCIPTVAGNIVTALTINTTTFWTGPVTITISPVGVGSGATGSVSFYGFGQSTTECVGQWYAKNITGTVNNQVTVTTGSSESFVGITVQEISGASTSSPIDTVVSGNAHATSVTTGAFGSGSAGYFSSCGGRAEALSQTWTAGSGYTIPTGATSTQTFMTGQYQANFNPNGTTTSMSSGSSVDRELICASFHN